MWCGASTTEDQTGTVGKSYYSNSLMNRSRNGIDYLAVFNEASTILGPLEAREGMQGDIA